MATKHKRIVFHAPDDIVQWLTSESERTGVLISEILRRLVKNAIREQQERAA